MSKKIGFVFLGPPGSGKGTQASKLASILSIPHISTGDILRSAIANNTPLGQQARVFVEKGDLVPDSLLQDLVRERLKEEDTAKGWILDGFPRTVAQASFLDALLLEMGDTSALIVNLDVPAPVLVDRLLARGRQDDTENTIRHRLDVYREQTAPVLDYYGTRGSLHTIDGDRSFEAVADSLKALVPV